MSVRRLSFAVVELSILGAEVGFAGCSLTVTAQWANGLVTINASTTGTCGWSGVEVDLPNDNIYIDKAECTAPTSTLPFSYATGCMPSGSHLVRNSAKC